MSEQYNEKDARSVMSPSEDVKDAIITFAMFHYENMITNGHSIDKAKELTANMIQEVYEQYCELGGIEGKLPMSTAQRLSKAVNLAKELSTKSREAYPLYSELTQLQAQLNRKR